MTGSIERLSAMLKSKAISSVELTTKYLENIKKYDKNLNSYITVTEDIALKQAKRADEILATAENPEILTGIPMNIKDNISTKGVETTCASKILKGYTPIYDAFAVEQLYKNGGVLLGKTNLDEFGMGSSCENSAFGTSLNPHNINKVPGGSSGGVASAVSAKLSVYGLGTDTGGSIRQPASFCGCVGLKPTYGSVSRFGLIAYCSSFDQIGPITNSVADASIVFDSISQYDSKDSTSIGIKDKTRDKLNSSIVDKKIGIPKAFYKGLSPVIDDAIKDALKVFESLGAKIVEIDLDITEFVLPVYYILACAEASSNLARYDGIRYGKRANSYNNVNEMIKNTKDEGFGDEVKRRIMLGNYVLSSGYYDAYYKKAQLAREDIIKKFNSCFNNVDVIVMPTAATTAFNIGEKRKDPVEMYLTDLYTVPINIASIPSISVPCGFDNDNMPIGMQILGNKFCESTILNFAYLYEEQVADKIYKKPTFGGDLI